MGLFAKLRAWLRPTPVLAPTQKPKLPGRQPAAPAPAAPVPPRSAVPAVTGPTAARVRLTVRFEDREGRTLAPPQVLHGASGEPVAIDVPLIPGFVLTGIDGFITQFPAAPHVICYRYLPRVAAPVVVYHRDEGGRLLANPEILIGKLNAVFTTQALPELAAHADVQTQTGHFTETSQKVTFGYDLARLTPGTPPAAAFIELMSAKATFAQPDFNQPLATKLPAHTFWRVFAMARESSGQVWLNIGGAQWLTAADTRPQSANPYRLAQAPVPQPEAKFAYTETTARQGVTITCGPHGVTQWLAPYGDVAPLRLSDGDRVMAVASVTAANGSRWLRLQGDLFIQARYAD
ncbi:MucBP domain-containing protein [Lacticaseibacillus suihuaensis]